MNKELKNTLAQVIQNENNCIRILHNGPYSTKYTILASYKYTPILTLAKEIQHNKIHRTLTAIKDGIGETLINFDDSQPNTSDQNLADITDFDDLYALCKRDKAAEKWTAYFNQFTK